MFGTDVAVPHFVRGCEGVREYESQIVVNREIGFRGIALTSGYRVVDLLRCDAKSIEYVMGNAIWFTIKSGQKVAGVKVSIAKFISAAQPEGNGLNCAFGLASGSSKSEYVTDALFQSVTQPKSFVVIKILSSTNDWINPVRGFEFLSKVTKARELGFNPWFVETLESSAKASQLVAHYSFPGSSMIQPLSND